MSSPPHPNPLPRGEREPEVPSYQRVIANSTGLALKPEIKRQTIEQPKRASGRSFSSVVTRKRPALNRARNAGLVESGGSPDSSLNREGSSAPDPSRCAATPPSDWATTFRPCTASGIDPCPTWQSSSRGCASPSRPSRPALALPPVVGRYVQRGCRHGEYGDRSAGRRVQGPPRPGAGSRTGISSFGANGQLFITRRRGWVDIKVDNRALVFIDEPLRTRR